MTPEPRLQCKLKQDKPLHILSTVRLGAGERPTHVPQLSPRALYSSVGRSLRFGIFFFLKRDVPILRAARGAFSFLSSYGRYF